MSAPFEPFSGGGRRILFVDDDPSVLSALGDYFQKLGYQTIRAANGRDGIAAFESQEPDVTILDLHLPDMDGLQVLEALRRHRAAVILLTGHGDIPTAVQAMRMGAENFLTKPVDMSHLTAQIERAIEKVDLRRENTRLLKLVPTTRRRVMQVVVAAVLTVAGIALGRLVGGIGTEPAPVPQIAPVRQPAAGSQQYRDTLGEPGVPAPPSGQAQPRRP
jgi:DNA-binding NtrC family response regulator